LDSTLGFPRDAGGEPYLLPGAPTSAYVEQQESVQYVKIGTEWVHYTGIGRNAIEITAGGRGTRGTVSCDHQVGEAVHVGRQFTVTFRLPAYREPVSGP
jgi:hypothetical protein